MAVQPEVDPKPEPVVNSAPVPSLREQTETPVGVKTSTVPEPTDANTSPLTKGELHGAAKAGATEPESATAPSVVTKPPVSIRFLLNIPALPEKITLSTYFRTTFRYQELSQFVKCQRTILHE
jgi:hypothetical protein